ncbi:type IV secretory system conjugative DNA transfer family protein [Bernardetia sp.]|uniref:type IV secretory system conjugative DNA transfer family protein n=1 Tax=Bernardetia sp. TaxID=1937974 RepID=UPI0025B8799C|nr:type IV secretory system conjugative DNA transfer family protein [Bernardetia sp.]
MDSSRFLGASLLSGGLAYFIKFYLVSYSVSLWITPLLMRLDSLFFWQLWVGLFILFLYPEKIFKTLGQGSKSIFILVTSLVVTLKTYLGTINFMFWKKKKKLFGNAEFADFWTRRKFLKSSYQGFSIGSKVSISKNDSYAGMIVVGPPSSGKSTITAFPSLLKTKNASWIVMDPSQELYETSGYLHENGYNILRLNVNNLKHSIRFNPLLRCKNTSDVSKLSETLIKMAYTSKGESDSYWTSSAKRLLKCFLVAIKNQVPSQAHLPNAYRMLSEFEFNREQTERFILENVDESTAKEFKGILAANSKEFTSFLSTAQTALEKFGGDDGIAWLVSGDTLDFNLFRQEKTVLFLQFPEINLPYYAPLINILTTQLMDFCMKEKVQNQRSIFFLLEEIGILRINELDVYLSQLRKYNAGALLILQDINQLSVQYGQIKAKAILGAINHKVFLGGLSHETCKNIESMLGRTTVADSNGREQGTNVLFANQIRMLPKNTILYISSTRKPVKLKVKPYYKHRRLFKRSCLENYEVDASLLSTTIDSIDYIQLED